MEFNWKSGASATDVVANHTNSGAITIPLAGGCTLVKPNQAAVGGWQLRDVAGTPMAYLNLAQGCYVENAFRAALALRSEAVAGGEDSAVSGSNSAEHERSVSSHGTDGSRSHGQPQAAANAVLKAIPLPDGAKLVWVPDCMRRHPDEAVWLMRDSDGGYIETIGFFDSYLINSVIDAVCSPPESRHVMFRPAEIRKIEQAFRTLMAYDAQYFDESDSALLNKVMRVVRPPASVRRAEVHELYVNEHDVLPGLQGDKPLCRFVLFHDRGDRS